MLRKYSEVASLNRTSHDLSHEPNLHEMSRLVNVLSALGWFKNFFIEIIHNYKNDQLEAIYEKMILIRVSLSHW